MNTSQILSSITSAKTINDMMLTNESAIAAVNRGECEFTQTEYRPIEALKRKKAAEFLGMAA